MFRDADVNGDGQLTFMEWFQWLGADSYDGSSGSGINGSGDGSSNGSNGSNGNVSDRKGGVQYSSEERYTDELMVASLDLVLSRAVSTLNTATRFFHKSGATSPSSSPFLSSDREILPSEHDASLLSAAFIAGGNEEFLLCTLYVLHIHLGTR